MAKYFDRKEQVIELELTSFGKAAFAAGNLTPKYYSFHDDDILYNNDFGISGSIKNSRPQTRQEKQNEIVDRIKDTPRISMFETNGWQFSHRTFEASGERGQTNVNALDSSPSRVTPATAKFIRTIGTSSPVKEYAPAWEIRTLETSEPLSVSGTENFPYRNGASGSELIIPFFSSSIPLEYDVQQMTVTVNSDNVVLPVGTPGGEELTRDVFELMEDGRLLIDVQELNTFFKGNGNFDIEVFKVPKEQEGEQNQVQNNDTQYEKLSFINTDFKDAEGMSLQLDPDIYATVLAGGDQLISQNIPKIDPSYVEYYLSIRVDSEIGIADLPTADVGGNLYAGGLNQPVDPCEDV